MRGVHPRAWCLLVAALLPACRSDGPLATGGTLDALTRLAFPAGTRRDASFDDVKSQALCIFTADDQVRRLFASGGDFDRLRGTLRGLGVQRWRGQAQALAQDLGELTLRELAAGRLADCSAQGITAGGFLTDLFQLVHLGGEWTRVTPIAARAGGIAYAADEGGAVSFPAGALSGDALVVIDRLPDTSPFAGITTLGAVHPFYRIQLLPRTVALGAPALVSLRLPEGTPASQWAVATGLSAADFELMDAPPIACPAPVQGATVEPYPGEPEGGWFERPFTALPRRLGRALLPTPAHARVPERGDCVTGRSTQPTIVGAVDLTGSERGGAPRLRYVCTRADAATGEAVHVWTVVNPGPTYRLVSWEVLRRGRQPGGRGTLTLTPAEPARGISETTFTTPVKGAVRLFDHHGEEVEARANRAVACGAGAAVY